MTFLGGLHQYFVESLFRWVFQLAQYFIRWSPLERFSPDSLQITIRFLLIEIITRCKAGYNLSQVDQFIKARVEEELSQKSLNIEADVKYTNLFKQIIPAIKIRHIERMADDSEFEVVENKQKKWTSTYSHQKRPDTSERLKHVIPKDKLVVKRGRIFTTDTSQKQLTKEIDEQDQREATQKNKAKQIAIHEPVIVKAKFACKNA